MKKITITHKIDGRTWGATLLDPTSWIAKLESKAESGKGWGFNARKILKSENKNPSLILSEEIDEEGVAWVNLDKEYEIVIEDISDQVLEAKNAEKVKNKAKQDFNTMKKAKVDANKKRLKELQRELGNAWRRKSWSVLI